MCTRKNCVCGPNNPRWKGGTWINSKGYRMVWAPGHPACNCRNYAPEHRKVWYDTHGSLPPVGYDVHHKNTNKLDNRPTNLEEKSIGDHGRENAPGGDHRRAYLAGVRNYRLFKGMPQAKARGAKGGRAAARNRRRRAQTAARKSTKRRRRRGGQLRLAA